MDRVLKQVCALLDSKDVELQCAAARVLGELKPRNGDIRRKLAKHLSTPNLTVKNYILSTLERMPGSEALPYLFPLLLDGGKIQERAGRIIAASGSAAIAEAKRLFPGADLELKKLLVRILGGIGSEDACRFLVDCIAADGLEINKCICLALREAIGAMGRQEKKRMLQKINAFLTSPKVTVSAEKSASGVILLGYVADPATLSRLLKYAQYDQPIPVREQALIALSHMEIPSKGSAMLAKAIIPMLEEDDYSAIVRNALTILQRLEIPKSLLPLLEERLRSTYPAVRSFVLSRLSKNDSKDTIKRLLAHLNSSDFEERRAAQEALAGIPKAYPHVIKELEAARDYEAGMRLVSILRAQRDQLGKGDVRRLYERMEKLWTAEDDRLAVYAAALKVIDPDYLVDRVLDRVKRLRGAKKFKEAESLLRLMFHHSLLTDDLKYEFVVVKMRSQPPDLSPIRRKDDEALRFIAELMKRADFPLVRRLKADKGLGHPELYHIGFHFSEKLFEQREFGIGLLKHLVKKSPRGKIGIAAKHKLKLVGVNV
jgi:HEAT repeat protein